MTPKKDGWSELADRVIREAVEFGETDEDRAMAHINAFITTMVDCGENPPPKSGPPPQAVKVKIFKFGLGRYWLWSDDTKQFIARPADGMKTP